MTVSGSNVTLTIKQDALLISLLRGLSTEQAAKETGISERTAYRWVKEPCFQEALEAARRKAFDRKLARLRDNVDVALKTLERNMGDELTIPPAVQVRAAIAWLEQAIAIHKLDEVLADMKELKRMLSNANA